MSKSTNSQLPISKSLDREFARPPPYLDAPDHYTKHRVSSTPPPYQAPRFQHPQPVIRPNQARPSYPASHARSRPDNHA